MKMSNEQMFSQLSMVLGHIIEKDLNMDALNMLRKGWESRKGYLSPYFNEDGRIIAPISFDKGEEVNEEGESFIKGETAHDFLIRVNNHSLAYVFVVSFFKTITAEELKSNRLKRDRIYDVLGRTYPVGTKLTSYIRAVILSWEKDPYYKGSFFMMEEHYTSKKESLSALADKICTAISTIKDTSRIPINVTLSINPVDILLASECTTGWGSCVDMDGGYKTSGLSYIMDEVTAIAYTWEELQSYKGQELPRKIWRQFVFFNMEEGTAYFQRQYPRENLEYAKQVRRLAAQVLSNHLKVPFKWWFKKQEVIPTVEKDAAPWIFFDVGHASRIRMFSPETSLKKSEMFIGEEIIPCLSCGEGRDIHREDNCGTFYCEKCNDPLECWACERAVEENGAIYVNDTPYCSRCFDEIYTQCNHCNTIIPQNRACYADYAYCSDCFYEYYGDCCHCGQAQEIEELIFLDDEYYCDSCFSDLFTKCEHCDDFFKEKYMYSIDNGRYMDFYCEDCYEELFSECVNCEQVHAREDLIQQEDGYDLYCEDCYEELKEVV